MYRTLLLSLRLNDTGLIRLLIHSISSNSVASLCQGIPVFAKWKLILHVSLMLTFSVNVEHLLRWLYNLNPKNNDNSAVSSLHVNKVRRLVGKLISHIELNLCTYANQNRNLLDWYSN